MIDITRRLAPHQLEENVNQVFSIAAKKVRRLAESTTLQRKTPVFTVDGHYVSQGWTEWTQGFQFGCQLLTFDGTGDQEWLDQGRQNTLRRMAPHLTSSGVHDHGFNNVSTYGNLLRLMGEGSIVAREMERELYELALKVSGAVQAMRWTSIEENLGYIYSFNGPHSLFADTIRSLRSLALAHQLGHRLMAENDAPVSLLDRLLQHGLATTRYNIYYGEGRDIYDVPGRVAHESLFNINDGRYRCPSTQQGYSPFSTWTRGLAWIILGLAEQLEFLSTQPDEEFAQRGGRAAVMKAFERGARVTCDFYLAQTPTDGIPYWDTGAPGLLKLDDYLVRPADPWNPWEPVDSSAAAIAAQGLLRMGRFLGGDEYNEHPYWQAGLHTFQTLTTETYLNPRDDHDGLLVHSIYHRPRGWDHVPCGESVPRGESCLWGDYHLLELALLVRRMLVGPYLAFWNVCGTT